MAESTAQQTPRIDLGDLIEVTHAAVLRATEAQGRAALGQAPAGPLRGPIIVGIIYNPQLPGELGQVTVGSQTGGER